MCPKSYGGRTRGIRVALVFGAVVGVFSTVPRSVPLSKDKTFPICVRAERSHPETDDKDLENCAGMGRSLYIQIWMRVYGFDVFVRAHAQ